MELVWWLIAFVVLVVLELSTLQLVSIWFAAGALGAMIAAAFGAGIEIQLIVFVLVSMLLLMMVRPVASRFLNKHLTKTNVDSLIGKMARVTSVINNREGFGEAVVGGLEWTAVSADDDVVIETGKMVIIKKISGVKLIVEEKREV